MEEKKVLEEDLTWDVESTKENNVVFTCPFCGNVNKETVWLDSFDESNLVYDSECPQCGEGYGFQIRAKIDLVKNNKAINEESEGTAQ